MEALDMESIMQGNIHFEPLDMESHDSPFPLSFVFCKITQAVVDLLQEFHVFDILLGEIYEKALFRALNCYIFALNTAFIFGQNIQLLDEHGLVCYRLLQSGLQVHEHSGTSPQMGHITLRISSADSDPTYIVLSPIFCQLFYTSLLISFSKSFYRLLC